MVYVFSFVFGAAVGSFLGVLLSRVVPDQESTVTFSRAMMGRSRCASCARTLAWHDLIPLLSFLAQRGRCRSCRARIPLQDLYIEIVTGSVFALLAWRFMALFPFQSQLSSALPAFWVAGLIAAWWYIAALCILIAFYDARYFLIPTVLLWNLIAAAVLANILYVFFLRFVPAFPETGILFSGTLAYLFGGSAYSWLRVLAGIGWGVGLIGGAFALSRGRGMGFGDVLIALALGILFGWPDIVAVLFVAFVLGTLVSLVLLAGRRKTMKSLVPFGPFLMLGALTTVLLGVTLTTVYLRVFPSAFL